eukprot:2378313-Lingulodinium_polyedra.AAC.1
MLLSLAPYTPARARWYTPRWPQGSYATLTRVKASAAVYKGRAPNTAHGTQDIVHRKPYTGHRNYT